MMEQPEEERDGQLQMHSGHGQVHSDHGHGQVREVGQQRVQRASEQGLHEGGHDGQER